MSVMKDLKQELCSWRLSRTELGLTKTFLTMRISIYFFIVPALRSIWPREPLAPFSQVSHISFPFINAVICLVGDWKLFWDAVEKPVCVWLNTTRLCCFDSTRIRWIQQRAESRFLPNVPLDGKHTCQFDWRRPLRLDWSSSGPHSVFFEHDTFVQSGSSFVQWQTNGWASRLPIHCKFFSSLLDHVLQWEHFLDVHFTRLLRHLLRREHESKWACLWHSKVLWGSLWLFFLWGKHFDKINGSFTLHIYCILHGKCLFGPGNPDLKSCQDSWNSTALRCCHVCTTDDCSLHDSLCHSLPDKEWKGLVRVIPWLVPR